MILERTWHVPVIDSDEGSTEPEGSDGGRFACDVTDDNLVSDFVKIVLDIAVQSWSISLPALGPLVS